MPNPNLVFACGVLLPQKLLGLEYFRGLQEIYPDALFPPVSGLGSVSLRAQQLADQIAKKFPSGEIHIVAHSLGGLDARCLLARNLNQLAAPGRVVSLSTISTPHRGSPVANLLLGDPIGLEFPFRDFLSQFVSANAHALVDLTTTGAPGFTEKDPVSGVRYFAYAGAGLSSALLFPTHVYVEAKEGDNDGMVSVRSASWPAGLSQPAWTGADHFAEIGYDLNTPDLATPFDYKGAIASIVAQATA
jgi:triacylglycerol lipase